MIISPALQLEEKISVNSVSSYLLNPSNSVVDRCLQLQSEMYSKVASKCQFKAEDLNQIQNLLPCKLKKKFEQAYQKIKLKELFSYATLKAIDRQDESKIEKRLDSIIEFNSNELFLWLNQQLAQIQVFSLEEAVLKSNRIRLYKEKIEEHYLDYSENLQLRKEIECTILHAFTQNSIDLDKIHQYWNWIFKQEEKGAIHCFGERQAQKLYVNCLNQFSAFCKKFSFDSIHSSQSFHCTVYQLTQDYLEELKTELSASKSAQIALEYDLIKGKLIIYTIINRELRKFLTMKFNDWNEQARSLSQLQKKISYSKTEYKKQNIKDLQEIISILKNKIGGLEITEEHILPIQNMIEKYQQQLEKEKNSIHQYYQKCAIYTQWDWARKYLKIDHLVLESLLEECKEKDFEKKCVQVYEVIWGSEIINPDSSEKLQLDKDVYLDFESLKNPMTFFLKRMKQQDEERLRLLQMNDIKIEEIIV